MAPNVSRGEAEMAMLVEGLQNEVQQLRQSMSSGDLEAALANCQTTKVQIVCSL